MLYWILGIAVGIAAMYYAGPKIMTALSAAKDWVVSLKSK